MSLKRIVADVYVYSGTEGSYVSTDKRYTIQKEKISSKDNIVLEIADLVRDYLSLKFNNDYLSETVWVSTSITMYKENDELVVGNNPKIDHFLAMDGYGYFEDAANPQLSTNALITTNQLYVPENTASKLPIFAEGVGKVKVDSTDIQITDSGDSNQKIQYVDIPQNTSEIKVYATDDTNLLKTIKVTNVCEPKYTTYKVTFVNKYGAYQDVFFFKKSIEALQVTEEDYKTNIINHSNVNYNTYEGQKQRYNVNGSTSISLNTGFVNEDFNSVIEELFLAENAWIRFENKTLPVITKSKSLTFKNSVNDKLINHTVELDFAFDKINNVR